MKKLLIGSFFFVGVLSCGPTYPDPTVITGRAQGTTFAVKYYGDNDLTKEIDSLFRRVDASMSNYMEGSLIKQFNASAEGARVDSLFFNVLSASQKINLLTEGAFDPSVYPLVKAWGFGPNKKDDIDSTAMDSLLGLVEMMAIQIDLAKSTPSSYLLRKRPGQQLDFNGIAQGYTVDLIAQLLDENGVWDYLIEVGGELRARGEHPDGGFWLVGVDRPVPGQRQGLFATLAIGEHALATSGNYRKFYESDGQYISHTIDAKTGRPVSKGLVSVTVRAPDCMTADAMATAFMVMGKEKAKALMVAHPQLELDALFMWKEGEEVKFEWTDGLEGALSVQE